MANVELVYKHDRHYFSNYIDFTKSRDFCVGNEIDCYISSNTFVHPWIHIIDDMTTYTLGRLRVCTLGDSSARGAWTKIVQLQDVSRQTGCWKCLWDPGSTLQSVLGYHAAVSWESDADSPCCCVPPQPHEAQDACPLGKYLDTSTGRMKSTTLYLESGGTMPTWSPWMPDNRVCETSKWPRYRSGLLLPTSTALQDPSLVKTA